MIDPADRYILRGQVLSFRDDPFLVGPDAAVRIESDGAILIGNGKIERAGVAQPIISDNPQLRVEHYADDLIMAGFVDCHVHYPQYEVIASYGEQLLEWLSRYTFPAELKFCDMSYARSAADFFLDECLRNGTTTASVYATVHPQSVDAFFAAASARDMCMATGKVMMDRNAPDGLIDTPQIGYDQSLSLLEKWHGRDRLQYVVTPRFAVTSTPEQLEAAGALWQAHPTTLMQTHIDENAEEISLVRKLFTEATDYFGVYEQFGLVGSGSNFGHAIHLTERERDAFRATGSGISHCPTSNLFLGSGLFDMQNLREEAHDIPVGLATDIGGGSSLSMLQTMKASYEICRLNGYNLHPAKAFYLATLGSAQTMCLGDRIGNVRAGNDADLIVLDLQSTPAIANRMQFAEDFWDVLFVQMMMADDRAVRATYINGAKQYSRPCQQ
ncbi:MAG: guanine deaminase [Hyphomicrobiaceae bacterium]